MLLGRELGWNQALDGRKTSRSAYVKKNGIQKSRQISALQSTRISPASLSMWEANKGGHPSPRTSIQAARASVLPLTHPHAHSSSRHEAFRSKNISAVVRSAPWSSFAVLRISRRRGGPEAPPTPRHGASATSDKRITSCRPFLHKPGLKRRSAQGLARAAFPKSLLFTFRSSTKARRRKPTATGGLPRSSQYRDCGNRHQARSTSGSS